MINKPLLTSTKRCPHMAVQRKMLRNSRICPGFSTCWMTGTGRWPVAMTMGWSKWLSPSKCILWLVVSTYPSEKWWSQLGWWHSQLNGEIKKNVPKHQPLFGCYSLYWSYSSHCHVVGKILVAPWLHVSYSECGYWTAESLRIAPSMYHWIDYMNPFSQYIIMIYIYIYMLLVMVYIIIIIYIPNIYIYIFKIGIYYNYIYR